MMITLVMAHYCLNNYLVPGDLLNKKFIFLLLFNKSMPLTLALAYGVFAFMSTLLREIIKDAEDIKGDQISDCKTLPIVLGIRKTKSILIFISIAFIIILSAYIFIGLNN